MCIKGCASDALSGKAKKLDPNKQYASVNLSMPKEKAVAVVERLYGNKPSQPEASAMKAGKSEPVNISLKNANRGAILKELGK
ncbi:MAG: hypothetical protein A2V91_01710 [Candidatus Muproteobacteria bacterium RBG_16_64_10]|uniref:Uncharacterized protein n=1 Tax=Candidatus Muproteobacteria bacterium RBG_16_64_10 TaxID=1817757 RepID=A0A1F6SXA9_9PROT|nr:MAG: hypothetical protein A2V91_01710 [Candidatus Muproteobacteria bacterium RBG_16_64_10]